MIFRIVFVAGFLAFSGSIAHASRADADACATSLSALGKSIYDKSLPGVLSGKSPADAVTPVARSMVMAGTVSGDDARPAAQAAGACLKSLK